LRSSVPNRISKIVTADEAIVRIPDGSMIAIGGLSYYGAPMDLVRALIRRGARNLTVVTAAVTGIQLDLLIAAGCVKKVISPYVAFEELGLAPAFRRAAEKRQIEVVEIGEAFLAFGLKAASSGSPFYVLPKWLAASDCPRVNSQYKKSTDPFTGETVVCVPAIRPDFTLLHARRADAHGNLQHEGSCFMDPLLARASRHVIATCDELMEDSAIRAASAATTVPGILVDAVVPAFGAAQPTASFGCYEVDRDELKRYSKSARDQATFAAYLSEFARPRAQAPRPLAERAGQIAALTSGAVAKAELIATVIARCVKDGTFTGAGTGCWEVLAGLRLAQLTHAPNASFTLGGTGALNAHLRQLPASLNDDCGLADCEARIGLEELFDLELGGAFDVMFLSGMQIDRYGNVNLAFAGTWEKPALRGPGTVGLEFAPCVPRWVGFFRNHTKQVFVPKVDFISAIGYGSGPHSRREFGIEDDHGPELIVTNLAVLDFCPDTLRMRLQSVHPGVTVERVVANTGFDLIVPTSVPDTPLPSADELSLLRSEIDSGGLLAKLVP
jgi:acyl CoA:acetate/3-ketoacid CoA transferase alpha subunit/acyl CoA:acetate/3-ketoacid CoA transferase beta subunit